MQNSGEMFGYTITYFQKGNVKFQELSGGYNDNFAKTDELTFYYSYDKSNRLLIATKSGSLSFQVENAYDSAGNITMLKRYNGDGSIIDNFAYSYNSGTNKLRKVSGSTDQYTYDNNGNMTRDDLNKNSGIKYDHRNLITELRHKTFETDTVIYFTFYSYDESGNRFAKTVYKTDTDLNPTDSISQDDMVSSGEWELYNQEFYSRDVSGREQAIYKNDELEEYPLYGLDLIGKLKNDLTYFYHKDHLGSVRAVVNADNELVSSQDYDPWGYILQDRTFDSDSSKFKFTSKERDVESKYDYFGARYYDARIGRWGQVEPLIENYLSVSSYCYSLNNPIIYKDVNGKDAIATIDEENRRIMITVDIYYSTNLNFGGSFKGTKLSMLKSYVSEANISWNKAGKRTEYKGIDYEVIYSFNLIKGNFSNQELMDILENNGGVNVALSNNYYVNAEGEVKTNVPAGVKQNILYVYDPKGGELTGSHELGHLMGLRHPAGFDEVYKDEFIDLMSYGKDKFGPRDWNVRLTIDGLNFKSTKNQIIKGASE